MAPNGFGSSECFRKPTMPHPTMCELIADTGPKLSVKSHFMMLFLPLHGVSWYFDCMAFRWPPCSPLAFWFAHNNQQKMTNLPLIFSYKKVLMQMMSNVPMAELQWLKFVYCSLGPFGTIRCHSVHIRCYSMSSFHLAPYIGHTYSYRKEQSERKRALLSLCVASRSVQTSHSQSCRM